MSEIRLEGITKSFGTVVAVNAVTLLIQQGELLTLLGPSGCGKTTLLRIIAGFETPATGQVLFDGAVVNQVPVEKRRFGMVFQSYALFPNMNVEANITFGLKAARLPAAEIRSRVADVLGLVRLQGYEKRLPSQLSGGQKQRVALARAIALNPRILLLDEPLSALDAKIRMFLRSEIRTIQKATGITTVYVTHDQEEALAISDRIAIMNNGSLQQVGSPMHVYANPANAFVAEFIGISNIIEGELHDGLCRIAGGMEVSLGSTPAKIRAGRTVLSVRPESLRLCRYSQRSDGASNTFPVRLKSIEYLGPLTRIVAECSNGLRFTVDTNESEEGFSEGEAVLLHIPPAKIRALEE